MMRTEGEGMIVSKVEIGRNLRELITVSVYHRENWESVKNNMRKITEEEKNECILIGRDFNARMKKEMMRKSGYKKE